MFKTWGQNVGFEKHQLGNEHRKHPDDPEMIATVRNILSSIYELASSADGTQATLLSDIDSDRKYSPAKFLSPECPAHRRTELASTSRRNKLAWTFWEKRKFVGQVQQFGALLQRLQSLVPMDDAKGAIPAHGGRNSGALAASNGTSLS
jgi:hypothetical protein